MHSKTKRVLWANPHIPTVGATKKTQKERNELCKLEILNNKMKLKMILIRKR